MVQKNIIIDSGKPPNNIWTCIFIIYLVYYHTMCLQQLIQSYIYILIELATIFTLDASSPSIIVYKHTNKYFNEMLKKVKEKNMSPESYCINFRYFIWNEHFIIMHKKYV